MPGRSGGAEPVINAPTHAADDPSNVDLITAGYLRTSSRFAAVSTISQHQATRFDGS